MIDETDILSDKIRERVQQVRQKTANKAKENETEMSQLLEQRKRYGTESRRVMESVITPMIKALGRQFENASIEKETEQAVVLRFKPSVRYPARVSVEFSASPDEKFENVKIRYDLELLPILLEHKGTDAQLFGLTGADAEIRKWVEARIFEFLDTYLQLETHPMYQRENVVFDPICGMRVLKASAVTLEVQGKTYYFCSNKCRDAFAQEAA